MWYWLGAVRRYLWLCWLARAHRVELERQIGFCVRLRRDLDGAREVAARYGERLDATRKALSAAKHELRFPRPRGARA